MTKRRPLVKLQSLLFGDRIASLLGQIEANGWSADRVVVIATDGKQIKLTSHGLTHFEIIGVLEEALVVALDPDDEDQPV
jgi:hypothetical protein